jgi:hypothetical protein
MNRPEYRRLTTAWQEYENMVTRVLPRFVLRQLYDLADDLDYMLFCRDEIETLFHQYPDDSRLVAYRTKILSLDVDLVLMRDEIFTRLPLKSYRAARKRNAIPRSHWWWYLDEIEGEPAQREQSATTANRVLSP